MLSGTRYAYAACHCSSRSRSLFRLGHAGERVGPADVTFARSADMRYLGQEHTVNVPIPGGELGEEQRASIESKFHELHEQLYTFRQESPIEIVNLRLTGFGAVRKPELQSVEVNTESQRAFKGTRLVDFDDLGRYETSIYERERLGAGAELEGPAVVEEAAASTLVLPGQKLRVDRFGNLVIEMEV